MAKFELKFIDCADPFAHIMTTHFETGCAENPQVISINGVSDSGDEFSIWLDKSTAIKFAKTLRTEINKITESEVGNG